MHILPAIKLKIWNTYTSNGKIGIHCSKNIYKKKRPPCFSQNFNFKNSLRPFFYVQKSNQIIYEIKMWKGIDKEKLSTKLA